MPGLIGSQVSRPGFPNADPEGASPPATAQFRVAFRCLTLHDTMALRSLLLLSLLAVALGSAGHGVRHLATDSFEEAVGDGKASGGTGSGSSSARGVFAPLGLPQPACAPGSACSRQSGSGSRGPAAAAAPAVPPPHTAAAATLGGAVPGAALTPSPLCSLSLALQVYLVK